MTPAIVLAVVAALAAWGGIIAAAVRYYVRTQLALADYATEMRLRESIQANSDNLSRAFGAIDTIERRCESLEDRVDRLSRRVNGYARRREASEDS